MPNTSKRLGINKWENKKNGWKMKIEGWMDGGMYYVSMYLVKYLVVRFKLRRFSQWCGLDGDDVKFTDGKDSTDHHMYYLWWCSTRGFDF